MFPGVFITSDNHGLGYYRMMGERVVVHLPAMPQPKDFGLDAQVKNDTPAAERYDTALKVWERVVSDIAKRIGSRKKG